MWRAAELAARDRGLDDCLLRCAQSPTAVTLHEAGVRVAERAQQAGAVRGEFPAGDVPALIRAALKAAPPDQWRSCVQIVLDGLRPR